MISELLARYQPADLHEAAMKTRLQTFLDSLPNHGAAFSREVNGEYSRGECGHITGSAWIVNENGTRAILLLHAKLQKWVQPGGHCDGESDAQQVAFREAREETGLQTLAPRSREIFDIDVHAIPEYWNTPRHFHYDIRFLFQADEHETPVVSHESREVRWTSLDEAESLAASESVARMIRKTRRLFAALRKSLNRQDAEAPRKKS